MSIKIKTLAVVDKNKVECMELETPDLQRNEVLVRVKSVALCTLEQRIFSGQVKMPLPATGGHEVSGEIVELGPTVNTKLWHVGQRVAVRMLYNCGECYFCRSGYTNMCKNALKKPVRKGMLPGPGGLCDYIIVKSSDLFEIPDTLSFDEAALTEPVACVVHSISKADIQLGDVVVVIGGGVMGQLHVMLAKLRGAFVVMCDIDKCRREQGKKFGADVVYDPINDNPRDVVAKYTGRRGANVVFNTTAIPEVSQQATKLIGRNGVMVQYSSTDPAAEIEIEPQRLHGSEVTFTGAISPTVQDFLTSNKILSQGLINTKNLIYKCYSFKDAQKAFEAAIDPKSFRVIINF